MSSVRFGARRARAWRRLALGCGLVAPLLSGRGMAAANSFALPVFQQDLGGVGLLETPTARMADTGEFSFTFNQVDPYRNYAFNLQPLSWLNINLRYTRVTDRPFGEDTQLLDKGFAAKVKLIDESRYIPAVSLGITDVGGTGLFGGEFVVASKRWYDFDFSLGLGTGRLGARGDIPNPLKVFSDRFEDRKNRNTGQGGTFASDQVFTGRPAFFGGVQYQTPYEPLTLQLEFEGNDYSREPAGEDLSQDTPFNLGARVRVNDNLTLSAAVERGNTAMLGLTLQANLADITQPKDDPPRIPPKPTNDNATNDWQGVASQLARNAGIGVTRIEREGHALVVEGRATSYRAFPKAELHANRILHNAAGPDITQFKYRWKRRGFYLREDTLPRQPYPDEPLLVSPAASYSDLDYRHGVVSSGASAHEADNRPNDTQPHETLYKAFNNIFSYSLSPGLNYNFGGPDGFLYQVFARLDTQLKTDPHGWFSNTLGYSLFDNLDGDEIVGPSNLPRVRTFVVRYLDETDLGVYNLQYTRTARLSENWFGMAYAGYLEQMFGGAGGEVMYRPFNSRVALGFTANWVKQRDFDTQFGFRDLDAFTGHATAYVQTGIEDILAKVSFGQYLAGDVGTTIDLSREFESGIRFGAFATFTSASSKEFGEGSFDKGVYLTFPLDVFFTQSTRESATALYRPLTRDGGAKLHRRYTLYGITQKRNLDDYWDDYERDR